MKDILESICRNFSDFLRFKEGEGIMGISGEELAFSQFEDNAWNFEGIVDEALKYGLERGMFTVHSCRNQGNDRIRDFFYCNEQPKTI